MSGRGSGYSSLTEDDIENTIRQVAFLYDTRGSDSVTHNDKIQVTKYVGLAAQERVPQGKVGMGSWHDASPEQICEN